MNDTYNKLLEQLELEERSLSEIRTSMKEHIRAGEILDQRLHALMMNIRTIRNKLKIDPAEYCDIDEQYQFDLAEQVELGYEA